jgi:small subunit ribosomal protein S6
VDDPSLVNRVSLRQPPNARPVLFGVHVGFAQAMSQPYYETMFILRPDIPEEEVETHVTKYRDLVSEAGAEVLDCQMRGKRRLAYPIAKHKEGIYVQLAHNGDGQQVATLERAMRLSEDVIRYLTVKQDGPLPAPRSGPIPQASSDAAALQTSEA